MNSYHYTECGLDNVYLNNGYTVKKGICGQEEISIHDIHGLHRAIAKTLALKSRSLSGKEIRFIRHYLDLSQKSMGALLGVSYQSVLGWEKGTTPIQEPSDRLIRTLVLLYMSKENGHGVYETINQIADLDACVTEESKSIVMEEDADEWRAAA